MKQWAMASFLIVGLLFTCIPESLAESSEKPTASLIVGIKEAPPFSMKSDNGQWTGISVDLWRQIAEQLNFTYTYHEHDLKTLLESLASGDIDVGVAALTVTAERETGFDFTHSFYSTGMGIAVASQDNNLFLSIMRGLFSKSFLGAVAGLFFLLLGIALLIWFFERKKNKDQFGGSSVQGIGNSFWWAAVTMTTVGYGDKAPSTLAGRITGIVWMFAAIIMISSFTAAIASSLTVQKLEPAIKGPEDLPDVRVGALESTTGEAYLKTNRIPYKIYPSVEEGLMALAAGKTDAFIHDAPILKYVILKQFTGTLKVLPKTFLLQNYAIGLPEGSRLREALNRCIPQITGAPEWQDTLHQYLGHN